MAGRGKPIIPRAITADEPAFDPGGGGYSHALLLRRWAMQPHRRPQGLITLVNRQSTSLYSGMVPGLVAGHYPREAVAIDLRQLSDQAGVAFVVAESRASIPFKNNYT